MKIDRKERKITELLQSYRTLFWDFDGVIKDSVAIKGEAYETLFMPFGLDIAGMVRKHHEANGGISRFDKIPLYLRFAGVATSESIIKDYSERFSEIVINRVINSPWVPGVREYLLDAHPRQLFILVTATPQNEIELILKHLDISDCFSEIFGAPTKKDVAVSSAITLYRLNPYEALMVGDSSTDLDAARSNGISFLLRRTRFNSDVAGRFTGPTFENLL